MELTNNYQIHHTLRNLIENKVARDKQNFSICQLAKALDMPHSMLVKLIHPDPAKRVMNPRIDTLAKIVSFFKNDGFDVSIDDLLGVPRAKTIELTKQIVNLSQQNIPIYSFEYDPENKIGETTIQLVDSSKDIISLLSDQEIKPFFKKGSLFVIDKSMPLENDQLVAVKVFDYQKVLIKNKIQQIQYYICILNQTN